MIRVMLVEDDPFWQKHLSNDINQETDMKVVRICSTKDESVETVQQVEVDVILMDLNLTENQLDGIEAIKEISKIMKVKIIVLTSLSDREVILEAFEYGAVNFITKSNVKDIIHAIRESHAEKPYIHADSAQVLRQEFIKTKRMLTLSPAEREIFELSEKGMSKNQIAQILSKSFHTVKNQMKEIRKKLQL